MEISAKQYGIVSDGIFSTRFPKISRLEPKRPNTIFARSLCLNYRIKNEEKYKGVCDCCGGEGKVEQTKKKNNNKRMGIGRVRFQT